MIALPRAPLAALVLAFPAVALAAPPESSPPLATRVRSLLESRCHICHGKDGAAKGGFGFVLDRDKLVARGKVIPGDAAGSELFQRAQSGEMPPAGKRPRLDQADLLLLRQWIDAGAPGVSAAAGRQPYLSLEAIQRIMLADLQSVEPRHRRFMRYLTHTHLANARLPLRDQDVVSRAVSKLLNSLTWQPRIVRPVAADPGATVLRIDLRDYKWNAATWDRLVAVYPYRLGLTSREGKALAALTGTDLPNLRGDWFVATASRPPLYHDLLQLPATDRGLERLLQVDVPTNLKEDMAARAGFNDSGVSKNNRLIERHDGAYGAYWRSYDFDGNIGRQNVFEHPLGPANGATSFAHAGGEMIFHLPNGLFGYLLADGGGRRIDKAPIAIVSDPQRPDRAVETGISCMSCHARGFLPKGDQVRAHVLKNAAAFAAADVQTVKALYPSKSRLDALLGEDNERYHKALARVGVALDEPDPVNAVTLRYEATLDLEGAVAELGLQPGELTARLKRTPETTRFLGTLTARGGTIGRQVMQDQFAEMVAALRLDEGTGQTAAPTADLPWFTGHTRPVLAVAIAPSGKLAASGGEDRTVRLWDLASGRELRRCQGHTDEVSCVAFSADGQRLLSAGRDRALRLWDVDSGQLLATLQGHTDRVRCLAFAPDGKHAVSAGDDLSVRLWDLAGRRELRAFLGPARPMAALAFAPDGQHVLGAGHDGSIRLWEIASGREVRRFEGHTREVFAVAFSRDGRRVLSGGNDRTVRLWDAADGRELRRFEGHANAVISVVFAADGRHVLSGASRYGTPDRIVRLWDPDSGREVLGVGERDTVSVGCLVFAPDGRSALTGGSGPALRLWGWAK